MPCQKRVTASIGNFISSSVTAGDACAKRTSTSFGSRRQRTFSLKPEPGRPVASNPHQVRNKELVWSLAPSCLASSHFLPPQQQTGPQWAPCFAVLAMSGRGLVAGPAPRRGKSIDVFSTINCKVLARPCTSEYRRPWCGPKRNRRQKRFLTN